MLVNHTRSSVVHYGQKGVKEVNDLSPQTSVLFSWSDYATKRRIMTWSCGESKDVEEDLLQDEDIKDFQDSNKNTIYRVSFLEQRQRVILFTEDLTVATVAKRVC